VPAGHAGCKPQAPVAAGDGCDQSLAWWFTKEPWAHPSRRSPDAKPVKPRESWCRICRMPARPFSPLPVGSVRAATYGGRLAAEALALPRPQNLHAADDDLPDVGPIPDDKPPSSERRNFGALSNPRSLRIEAVKSIELPANFPWGELAFYGLAANALH
jgi:hypothetical protein